MLFLFIVMCVSISPIFGFKRSQLEAMEDGLVFSSVPMSNRILTMLQNRNAALNSPNSKLTDLYFEAMKKLAIDKGIPIKTTEAPTGLLKPANSGEYAKFVYDPQKFTQKTEKTGSALLCRRLRMC